jgi:hypothetical protein
MTITPFLAVKLGGKKDAVLARQRGRRVASVLSFDVYEQACIAAGTFLVASQAVQVFGKARLCFQIENHQLQVFAEPLTTVSEQPTTSPRLAGLFPDADSTTLLRLTKPLPALDTAVNEVELGWLVKKVEETAGDSVYDEIVKQNQEMLALLHELRLCRGDGAKKEGKSANPHAA